jgi:hypothetical protein
MEQLFLGDAPSAGFGQSEVVAPATAQTPSWALALATSVMSAAAGWVIEEAARSVRGKRK